jgi:hypothetical protein
VEATATLDEAPAIARAGQDFALHNLTAEALHCYWYGAIVRYAELFFAEQKDEKGRS